MWSIMQSDDPYFMPNAQSFYIFVLVYFIMLFVITSFVILCCFQNCRVYFYITEHLLQHLHKTNIKALNIVEILWDFNDTIIQKNYSIFKIYTYRLPFYTFHSCVITAYSRIFIEIARLVSDPSGIPIWLARSPPLTPVSSETSRAIKMKTHE